MMIANAVMESSYRELKCMQNHFSHTELYNNPLEILWQEGKEGARILRVYGDHLAVRLPDRLAGLPVTEIGAYCFSASEHLPPDSCQLTRLTESGEEMEIDSNTFPSISGHYVESVFLPDTVTTLHNAAFYNCRKMKLLSVGERIHAIGSDEFLNCVNLKTIILRGKPKGENGLFLLLERLISDVEVRFCPTDSSPECVIFFPEYYEWLNEISPAHVFSRSIEGEGFRMRHTFQNHRLDFIRYDQCFPDVLKGESDKNICRIAVNRLRWPIDLQNQSKSIYEEALRTRPSHMMHLLIENRDLGGMEFFCRNLSWPRGVFSSWAESCIRAGWSEGAAYLMEIIRISGSFAKKSFAFDDFDFF